MFLWERIFRTRRPNRFLRVAYDVVARHVSDHGHRRLPDQYQPRFIHTRDSRIGPCLVKMIQWARWFRGVYAGISFEYCASVRSMRNATTTLRNARKRERKREGEMARRRVFFAMRRVLGREWKAECGLLSSEWKSIVVEGAVVDWSMCFFRSLLRFLIHWSLLFSFPVSFLGFPFPPPDSRSSESISKTLYPLRKDQRKRQMDLRNLRKEFTFNLLFRNSSEI